MMVEFLKEKSWGILNGCKGDKVGEFIFTGEKGRQ